MNMENSKLLMVAAAHPDDPEFGSGGTVAKMIGEGWQAIYVICTKGDKGTSDLNMTSEKLAEIRVREQRNAAAVLGVNEVVFLGHPDGFLKDEPVFRGELVKLIRKYRPALVITHDPFRKYVWHHDHRVTGLVCMDAVYPCSRDRLFYPEHISEGLMIHKVREVYLTNPEEPNRFIDIGNSFILKMKAISCHVSQVGDHTSDWEKWVDEQRKPAVDGQLGSRVIEAFHRIEIMP